MSLTFQLGRDVLWLAMLAIPAWLFARLPRLRPTLVEVVSESLLFVLVGAALVAGLTLGSGRTLGPGTLAAGSILLTAAALAGHLFRAGRDPRPRKVAFRESLWPRSEDPGGIPTLVAAALTFLIHAIAFDPEGVWRLPVVRSALHLVGIGAAAGLPVPSGAVSITGATLAAFGSLGPWLLAAILPATFVLFAGRIGRSLAGSPAVAAAGGFLVANTPVLIEHVAPAPAMMGATFLVAGLALALDLDAPRLGPAPVPDASPLPVHASVGDVAAAAGFGALALASAVVAYPPSLPLALAILAIALLIRPPEAPGTPTLLGIALVAGLIGAAPGLVAVVVDGVTPRATSALELGLPAPVRPLLEVGTQVGSGLVAVTVIGLARLLGSKPRVPTALSIGMVVTLAFGTLLRGDKEALVTEAAILAAPLGAACLQAGFMAMLDWRRTIAVGLIAAVVTVGGLLASRFAVPSDNTTPAPGVVAFERARLTRGYPWPRASAPSLESASARLAHFVTELKDRRLTPSRHIAPMTTAPVDVVVDVGRPLPFEPEAVAIGTGADGTVDATERVAVRIACRSAASTLWLVRTASDRLLLLRTDSGEPPEVPGVSIGAWGAARLNGDRLGLRVRSGDRIELRTEMLAIPGLEYTRDVVVSGHRLDVGPVRRRGPG